MNDEVEFEFGVKRKARKEPLVTENSIIGGFWEVEKRGDKCFFHYDTGSHSGKMEIFEVPYSTYDDVKSGRVTFREVIKKYYVHK